VGWAASHLLARSCCPLRGSLRRSESAVFPFLPVQGFCTHPWVFFGRSRLRALRPFHPKTHETYICAFVYIYIYIYMFACLFILIIISLSKYIIQFAYNIPRLGGRVRAITTPPPHLHSCRGKPTVCIDNWGGRGGGTGRVGGTLGKWVEELLSPPHFKLINNVYFLGRRFPRGPQHKHTVSYTFSYICAYAYICLLPFWLKRGQTPSLGTHSPALPNAGGVFP
jgi:hypothetical protein